MTLIAPDGKRYRPKNLKKFSREFGVKYTELHHVYAGDYTSYKGWYSTHPKSLKAKKRVERTIVNVRTGEHVVLGRNAGQKMIELGMNAWVYKRLFNEKKLMVKGWVTKETWELFYNK